VRVATAGAAAAVCRKKTGIPMDMSSIAFVVTDGYGDSGVFSW